MNLYLTWLTSLLVLSLTASAQVQKVTTIDFENIPGIVTTSGQIGKAFDLGNVTKRYAIAVPNPIKDCINFTITVWVKADENGQMPYTIAASQKKQSKGYDGWKFGIQANGAWNFQIQGNGQQHTYNPTPFRQSIRDGKWHQLAVTHDVAKQRLSFYYDGQQKAIYHVPGLQGTNQADSLVIGNSIDHEKPFLTEQWESFYGSIDDISCHHTALSATEIQQQYAQLTGKKVQQKMTKPTSLSVTSFNIWHGGNESGKEVGLQRTIALMKESQADVFTLVETYGSGERIADALGYYFYLISSNLSIMSRYPFTDTYPIYRSFNSGGAQITLPGGQPITIVATWLHYLPDYWSGFLKEKRWDLADFMNEENKTRGAEMKAIVNELQPFLDNADQIPIIIAGDFNSGSHLDWTEKTKHMHHNYSIEWPASTILANAGVHDAWRIVYPDPQLHPGFTWSPIDNSTTYQKDRIDYIYYKGNKLTPKTSTVMERHPIAFPSDHAGVNVVFKFQK